MMQAVISTHYGSPDALQVTQVEQPTPKADEVLIKVRRAVVTPSDSSFLKGDPLVIRLMYGLTKPRLAISGVEFAGEIVAVGADVNRFKSGDRVFGMSPNRFGAHAEYLCLPEDKVIAPIPEEMSDEEAVAICDGGTTALTFLRDVAKVQPGEKVLINGASGAVGAYAVQIAKHFGVEVTGVCSGANVELVKSLGADHVIDYTREDFAQGDARYDVIFDAVGKSSFSQASGVLTPDGRYLTTVPNMMILPQVAWTALRGGKKAKFATAGLMQSRANLAFLTRLFEAGEVKAVIDRRYPLTQIADAYRYVDTGRKKGNVVIQVA